MRSATPGGADSRAVPGSPLPPMEAEGGGGVGGRWSGSRIPEFTQRRTATGASCAHGYRDAAAAERGRTGGGKERREEEERERGGGPRKSVTMAPTSRYLTDRQYVMRKPLFFTEQQTSILKRSQGQEEPEQDKRWPGESTESYHHHHHHHINMDYLSRPRDEAALDRLDLSQGNVSPSSSAASREEDPMSPLGVSDLRGASPYRDHEPSFGSAYAGGRSGQRGLCSPPAEAPPHTPTSPPSPRLTSALLLSPTYTPHSRHLRPQRADFRLGGKAGGGTGGGESRLKVISSTGYFQGRGSSPLALHAMSPNQASYWACAIPRSLPPSPDRRSRNWDPDREYQDLLDYTYPLRPGRVVSEWDHGSDPQPYPQQGASSLLHGASGLQDSGIELDRICCTSSASPSALDFSLSRGAEPCAGAGRPRPGPGPREAGSSRILGLSKSSSDGLLYTGPLSPEPYPEDLFALSLEESLDVSSKAGGARGNRPARNNNNVGESQRRQQQHHHHASSARSPSYFSSSAFIRSTSVLPRPGSGGDWDEDYRPLPDQLEELHALSRQVREVIAQISQPVSASWDSLDPGTTSVYSSTPLRGKRAEESRQEREASEERAEDDADRRDEGVDREEEERGAHGTAQYFSKAVDHGVRVRQTQLGDGGVTLSSLREVEALVGQLSGLTFPEVRGQQENQEQTDSLMQHIQVFCSNLGELIHWLYTVVERMTVLAPPTADIESVKSSLAEYQSFQREMSAHHPLTSSVLDTGALLLSCMNSTSPVLRDTLLLIESQSRALESHTEHLFSSILSAMDSLTQPAGRPGATASQQPAGSAPQPSGGQEMRTIRDSGIVGDSGDQLTHSIRETRLQMSSKS